MDGDVAKDAPGDVGGESSDSVAGVEVQAAADTSATAAITIRGVITFSMTKETLPEFDPEGMRSPLSLPGGIPGRAQGAFGRELAGRTCRANFRPSA